MNSQPAQADFVLKNAKVITVDQTFSIQQAIAVKDGRILSVGSNDDVKKFVSPTTKIFDLNGKSVLPGINDSHMHGPLFGATRPPLSLDLTFPNVQSISDMVDALKEKVAEVKPGEWIRGFGWDQSTLAECKDDPLRLPRKKDIDAVSPDNPVVFTDFSAHTMLVNSKALEIANLTQETPDPESGEIEKDPKTGELTGIFKELGAQSLVAKYVPLLTRAEKKQAVLTAMEHLSANGVTSFTDAAIGPGGEAYVYGVMSAEFCQIYQELLSEGKLTTRVNILLLMGNYGALTLDDIKKSLKAFEFPKTSDANWLKYPGIKIFADGIPLTYSAWMNEDYVSGDVGHGRSVIPGDTDKEQSDNLVAMIKYIHSKGYQIGIHATGDRAIDTAVDGMVQAMEENPVEDLRHYIVHADFLSPKKAAVLAKHNFGVSMQPFIHAMICDFEPTVVGAERAAREFPFKTVLKAGIPLTNSSDAPVTYPNWRMGIQAAVLRESLVSGSVSGPEECISVQEAIQTYTINGAWQDHMEDIKGSIEKGKLADLCIIDKDILTISPHEIGSIAVLMTIVDGKVVFDKSNGAFEKNNS
ncbi:amidohydrolase [Desulfobacula sp.]|uniref:amidohydrolase n=1 Tax=Desulfobacula sp. TaxID=2593537 RepID=UPI0026025CD2|nr:amidohydrolase [Desulfobacula sp.]